MIPNGLIEPNKIYIIGDRQVGKTNLVNRLTNKEFEVHTISPLGIESNVLALVSPYKTTAYYTLKDVTDDKVKCKYIKKFLKDIENAKMVIVLFSIFDLKSFEYAEKLIEYILSSISNNFMPILLVGNKNDLLKKDKKKRIPPERIIAAFKKMPEYIKYFEISLKEDNNASLIKEEIERIELDQDNYEEEEAKTSKLNNEDSSCIIF